MDDHSFVAGLGYHPGLEEDENPLDLAGPQATSTVAAKMTRDQINRQYLQNLEEASEGSSEEFCSLRSASRASAQYPYLLSSGEQQSSSGVGRMMALSLINTEAMSGLSSSKFLVDHTQLNTDPVENEASREPAGLPSALLEPQGALLDEEQQDLTEGDTKNVSLLTDHLTKTKLGEIEFPDTKHDGSQMSEESIIKEDFKRPLDVSKLLSNSCNSLGSMEGQPDPFLSHQEDVRGFEEDWFETDQHELAEEMEGEEFQAPDMSFFDEEERQHQQERKFCLDAAPPSKASLDLSCFSGIHGVSEITVRPSWIESPEKELLGPNNRMLVDDYLQARSEALGTLEPFKDPSSRPNFGNEVHSPPNASAKLQPLLEMTAGGDSRDFESSASTQEDEESLRSKVVHAVEELEVSRVTAGQPVQAATIGSLLSQAMATNQPHELVKRILCLTQEPSGPASDTTGLDASVEVAELRKLKEEVVRQKQGPARSHPTTKENKVVSVPEHLTLREACVVGVATHTALPLRNTSSRWLQVSLCRVKETIDGSPSTTSALLFEASHVLEPQRQREVMLGVCSPVQGKLSALIQVQVGELAATEAHSPPTSCHTVRVSATIVIPEVKVQCEDGGGSLDFGLVGESCCVSQAVTLTSHCPQPLPVLLHLQQMAAKAPIFCWEEDKNKCGTVVSSSHLSCELTPSTPTTFFVTLRAPYLDGIAGAQNRNVMVKSYLKVLLDTPAPTQLTLASCPVKALIGLVQLEILRTAETLTIKTALHQPGTTELTLKNGSSFPLRISLSFSDHCRAFSISPPSLTMSPGTRTSLSVSFMPGASSGTLNSMLLVRVEPDGMEFEIPISGVCSAPPPSSLPSSAAPASSLTPPYAPPVHSALKRIENIHNQVTKSSSAPLSEVPASGPYINEKTLSSALDCTKSHLVFGAVAVGDSSCQKITLRNALARQELPLSITIIGSPAFQVCENENNVGQEKLNVVLSPSQEVVLCILLRPSTVESLAATLLLRHRSSTNPFKWKIPLQGYGGRGELMVRDGSAGKPVIMKDLSLDLPAFFQTTVTNVGQRTLCIALQVFLDKHCKEVASDLSVQPTRLVVGPGQTQEIYIVASGTQRQLAKTPGIIGVLQVISGEEILRKRYRRMKNKEVKARHITNPDLLKLNWVEEFTGEKKALNESDLLPPQPEDAVVFFNSCITTLLEVWGEQRPNEDQSTTVFASLAGEETVADFTFTQERVGSSTSTSTPADPVPSQASLSTSWDVLPQTLNVRADDGSPHVFFVVNFSNTQQMLEVSSDCKWLEVKPCEAVLAGHSSVRLCVTTHLPRTPTSPITYSLKVMGENESRCATITILPTTEKESGAHHPPPKPVPAPETPTASSQSLSTHDTENLPPVHSAANPHKPSDNTRNTQQLRTTNSSRQSATVKPLHQTSTKHTNRTAPVEAQSVLPSGSRSQRQVTRKCQVQLMSDNAKFQDTKVFQETYVKVMLRNLDKIEHSVQAEVKSGPFAVRHRQFTIKSGHYINIPVYFKPLKSGLSTGQLQLTVLKDKVLLLVSLSGRTLP
ncbi:centrosomal protein of 192 kDa-like isoform X2 [Eriocheir sinensis]|uniref:centrosomal protein of 192 kDa-like isoform X2 n=1 Tax=Eriocheir sinensis TaxID=95602 RepID=UPI0021C8ADDF|nr:centrosomal protein of 192 kDa-like isoform X2 [Eriocheir sinensis]